MFSRKPKALVEPGQRAPQFELKNLSGGTESLAQVLAKGPALLAFFKVSCPVCQLAVPYLERLSASQSLQVIGISQDDDGSTKGFNQRFGVSFPTLLDSARENYPASNAYGISAVPSLFLVEPDGTLAKSLSGFSKRDLEALGTRAGVTVFRPEDQVPDWKPG